MTHAAYPGIADAGVVVTGGGSGIGADIVRVFAGSGAKVAFLDLAEEAGRDLEVSLAAAGAQAKFLACDVTDIAALQRTLDAAAEAVGPVRTLVNNAALDQRQSFAEIDEAALDAMLAVNFKHVFFASQRLVPPMRKAGGGAIVNLTSTGWMRGTLNTQAYAASKAAIVGFTNSLARELGPAGIRVNAVAPGWVVTERQKRMWMTTEARAAAIEQTCLKALPSGEDIARLVLFLASDHAKAITKQTMVVDCGAL